MKNKHHRARTQQQVEKSCLICGCTQSRACVTSDGGTCGWSIEMDNVCDFCMVAAADLAMWIRLQAENRRNIKPLIDNLLRGSAQLAITPEVEQEEPKVEIIGEAEANEYLRARGAAGGLG
jgi:hypothetical protein